MFNDYINYDFIKNKNKKTNICYIIYCYIYYNEIKILKCLTQCILKVQKMFNQQPITKIIINTCEKCFPTSKFQVQNPKQVSKWKLANYKLVLSHTHTHTQVLHNVITQANNHNTKTN